MKKGRFSPSSHIAFRIWCATILVIACMLIPLILLMNLIMPGGLKEQALEQVGANVTATAKAFGDSYEHTMGRFIENCSTVDFKKLLVRMDSAAPGEQTALNNDLQSTLSALINQSPLVRSAVFVNRGGMVFRPLSKGLRSGAVTWPGPDTAVPVRGVTLLPRTESPLTGLGDVIPLAIPLAVQQSTDMTVVAPDLSSASVILYLYLDAGAVDTLLNTYSAEDVSGPVYLMNAEGLSLPGGSPDADLSAGMAEALRAGDDAPAGGRLTLKDRHAVWHRVGGTDLAVVCLISDSVLTGRMDRYSAMMLPVLLACVLAVSLVCFISYRMLRSPLRSLMDSIRAMEKGTYRSENRLKRPDELGRLSSALDTMYHEIKKERSARDQAEIRLISEQINPHFLYNTLESINMEVYSNRNENASRMIQNLGEFMRIGLSFGSRLITVSRELEHVQAYVNIMNHRFSRQIVFTTDVEEECLDRDVLKIILQPLVENSIRHGFRLDTPEVCLGDPFISVEVRSREDGGMTLSVIDNGIGIDIAKAREILLSDPSRQRHVGLNNVYQRLRMYYGPGADITFESEPYFRNTVCLHLPPCVSGDGSD